MSLLNHVPPSLLLIAHFFVNFLSFNSFSHNLHDTLECTQLHLEDPINKVDFFIMLKGPIPNNSFVMLSIFHGSKVRVFL